MLGRYIWLVQLMPPKLTECGIKPGKFRVPTPGPGPCAGLEPTAEKQLKIRASLLWSVLSRIKASSYHVRTMKAEEYRLFLLRGGNRTSSVNLLLQIKWNHIVCLRADHRIFPNHHRIFLSVYMCACVSYTIE